MEIDSIAQYKSRALSLRRLLLGKAKLKASSRTSALLSGFAMVAMVEIQLGKSLPQSILITFSIITTLVVALHLLALMISTCILPHLEAVSEMQTLALIHDSPHDHFYWYIEIAWFLSTGIGIFLFLAQMAMLAWVRFYGLSQSAHLASTAIILPVIFIFIAFAVHFHHKLISVKCHNSTRGIVELEQLALDLDEDTSSNADNKQQEVNTPSKPSKQLNNTYNITYLQDIPTSQQKLIHNGMKAVFTPINPLLTTPVQTSSRSHTRVVVVPLPEKKKLQERDAQRLLQNDNKENVQLMGGKVEISKASNKPLLFRLFSKKPPPHQSTLHV